jgi:hypothetical protein
MGDGFLVEVDDRGGISHGPTLAQVQRAKITEIRAHSPAATRSASPQNDGGENAIRMNERLAHLTGDVGVGEGPVLPADRAQPETHWLEHAGLGATRVRQIF